tara:strand:+ start:46 stop:549 length:504 start_codon:yes stop_codon:yes gene_type:complete
LLKKLNAGFTFLEIFISLFILGLVSTLVVPRYLASKTYIALKTSSKELSELFFLSQQKASSFGVTTNVSINYSTDNPDQIESLTFYMPHPYLPSLEESMFNVPQFVSLAITQPITNVEFYSDKTWSLIQNSVPLSDHSLSVLLSFKDSQYHIRFYPNSSSIQLIKPL